MFIKNVKSNCNDKTVKQYTLHTPHIDLKEKVYYYWHSLTLSDSDVRVNGNGKTLGWLNKKIRCDSG